MADVVEGCHGGGGVAFLDGQFKGLQVDFPDGLLVGPDTELVVTVEFLVVEGKVLEEAVDAALLSGSHRLGSHLAAELCILGVVLEISSREGGAMDVHGRAVPAVDPHLGGFGADELAQTVGQLLVPGAGQGGGAPGRSSPSCWD